MSKRDSKILFMEILESIEKIESYTKDISFDDFAINSLIIDAVVRNFEIIGEASKNIPEDIQEKLADIPWQKLRGIRNRIVHEYFKIDNTILWHIIQNELQPLKETIKQFLIK